MALSAPSRARTLTTSVRQFPLLSIDDLRIAALDPGVFPAACDYAQRFFPRSTMARAA